MDRVPLQTVEPFEHLTLRSFSSSSSPNQHTQQQDPLFLLQTIRLQNGRRKKNILFAFRSFLVFAN